MAEIGRNEACPCGGGKKYKHCHWKEDRAASPPESSPAGPSRAERRASGLSGVLARMDPELVPEFEVVLGELARLGEEEGNSDPLWEQLLDDESLFALVEFDRRAFADAWMRLNPPDVEEPTEASDELLRAVATRAWLHSSIDALLRRAKEEPASRHGCLCLIAAGIDEKLVIDRRPAETLLAAIVGNRFLAASVYAYNSLGDVGPDGIWTSSADQATLLGRMRDPIAQSLARWQSDRALQDFREGKAAPPPWLHADEVFVLRALFAADLISRPKARRGSGPGPVLVKQFPELFSARDLDGFGERLVGHITDDPDHAEAYRRVLALLAVQPMLALFMSSQGTAVANAILRAPEEAAHRDVLFGGDAFSLDGAQAYVEWLRARGDRRSADRLDVIVGGFG